MTRRSVGSKPPGKLAAPGSTAQAVAKQRRVQSEVETPRRRKGSERKAAPPQTGARRHPQLPFPAQHLKKPGLESELRPAPQFMAPDYLGSKKLLGRVALITGGDSGIGRAVAVLFAREGADVAVVYLNLKTAVGCRYRRRFYG